MVAIVADGAGWRGWVSVEEVRPGGETLLSPPPATAQGSSGVVSVDSASGK